MTPEEHIEMEKSIRERPLPLDSMMHKVLKTLKEERANEERANSARRDEVVYTTVTSRGKMKFRPSDIMDALKEQSSLEGVEITPPEEDLWGWSVINATDENGASRPLFLMRVLPGNNVPISYSNVERDDEKMRNIILRDVYKLTPIKIKWITFKMKVMNRINKIFKRK